MDSYGNWGFPKGHINPHESAAQAARREVIEETGLHDLALRSALSTIDWHFRFEGNLIHKYCHYFLFEVGSGEPVPELEEGIAACRWYSAQDALDRITYANAGAVLQEAIERVREIYGERQEP